MNIDIMPKFNEDGSIWFPSKEALDMYISATETESQPSAIEQGYKIGIEQAIEVINQFPNLSGWNEGKTKIQEALKQMERKVNPGLYTPQEVIECLTVHLMPVVYSNGYPIRAVPQSTLLSLGALMKVVKSDPESKL